MIQLYHSYSSRGPGKVIENLKKGLALLNENYEENGPAREGTAKIALSSHFIINTEHVKDMFIGPNLCTLPIDNGVVMAQQYRKMVVPSEWVKQLYMKWLPEEKLFVWPVGIDTDKFHDSSHLNKTIDCLIYAKNRPPEELKILVNILKAHQQSFDIITYGSYSEEDFIQRIGRCRYCAVLDNTESQGIALEEIMSCNLPMFVWDATFWNDRGPDNSCSASSVPFWSEECGIRVIDKDLLSQSFQIFLDNQGTYNPRSYIVENLGLAKQAQELVQALNTL